MNNLRMCPWVIEVAVVVQACKQLSDNVWLCHRKLLSRPWLHCSGPAAALTAPRVCSPVRVLAVVPQAGHQAAPLDVIHVDASVCG